MPENQLDLRISTARVVDVLRGEAIIYADGMDLTLSGDITRALVAAFVEDEQDRANA